MKSITVFWLAMGLLFGPAANACDGYIDVRPGPVVVLCPGESITFHATGFMVQPPFTWSDGTVGDSLVVSAPGFYSVHDADGCGMAIVTIVEADSQSLTAAIVDTICPGQSAYVGAGFFNATFTWEDGSTQHPREFKTAGHHVLTCALTCGTYQKSVEIFVRDTAAITLPAVSICGNQPVVLSCPVDPPYSLTWPDGSRSKTWEVNQPGTYWVASRRVCVRNFFFPVEEDPACQDCQPQFPNAFSPNADAINDVLMDYSHCRFRAFALTVFDRWGREVFSGNNPQAAWNGTIGDLHAPEGVYFWVLQYENMVRAGVATGNVVLVR